MNSRILPLLALMLAIGVFFTYVSPTWSGPIADTKVSITNDEQALAAAKEYTARQSELASERDLIDKANLAKLEVLLPDSVDNVGLILDVNALAARSGLSLSNIDVAKNTSTGASASTAGNSNPVGSVDITLSATGTYTAMHSFLAGIEKSARILDIKNITVSGSDTGVYNYQMTISLYWLR